jgi:undecaprenyl diphosphate synthase
MTVAFESGVRYFTFWAGSFDNLKKRSTREIKFLTTLLKIELGKRAFLSKLVKNNIRFRFIGEWRIFLHDPVFVRRIVALEDQTRDFKRSQLTILFAYDGIREMLSAFQTARNQNVEKWDYKKFKNFLWTAELPEVDLVIRTGGEPHWSAGFMMWLAANSQFYFTSDFWPEFSARRFSRALKDYSARERRFGS